MNNNLAENLKKIRKDHNLSQEQLAEELGVSRQAISKWESAVAYPEMDKILYLCEKFNLKVDDLLQKDIRKIQKEEEGKKIINKYIDDFLNFITNTINMFIRMNIKSKIKCVFEQLIISSILFLIFLIIGYAFNDRIFVIFSFFPEKIYYIFENILELIYFILSLTISLMIILNIFKTRYLNYYENIKEEKSSTKEKEIIIKEKKEENKIDFKESKIIIRDPKHSEYKFIRGISKIIIGILKFFALCLSLVFFITLIVSVFLFIISFLIYKTGLFFIGLLIFFMSLSIISTICILIILNFIFNRKNDKKRIIWLFIISLITIGISIGFISIGLIDFKYDNKLMLKTEYMEFDMHDELYIYSYYFPVYEIEYIESNNNNVKIEYQINKYCDMVYYKHGKYEISLEAQFREPNKMIKEGIKYLNEKKLVPLSNKIVTLKVYTTKENIEKIKNNLLH